MTTATYAVSDTITMLRRNLKNQLRYPTATLAIVGIPVLFLLLFVYVLGGALGTAVTHVAKGRAHYVDYVLPGLIVMTAATGSLGTSASTSVDMTEGIIARFRTMAIFRPSILIARVLSSVIQTLASMALVFGIAVLMGFSPAAGVGSWAAAIGLLALASFALTWLGIAFGLSAKTLDAASNAPFPLIMLPFVGSGIVPTHTMPTGLRYFAQYQPFTPIIETLRGLLLGTRIGNSGVLAIAWCVGITAIGFFWAMKAFARERTAQPAKSIGRGVGRDGKGASAISADCSRLLTGNAGSRRPHRRLTQRARKGRNQVRSRWASNSAHDSIDARVIGSTTSCT